MKMLRFDLEPTPPNCRFDEETKLPIFVCVINSIITPQSASLTLC